MKRIFHNRIVLAVCCIALSLVICLVVAPTFNTMGSRQVEIVRVKTKISENSQIKKDMIETVSVGGYHLPSNVITDPNKVINKYVSATLEPGDYILDSKVSEKAPNEYVSKLDGKKVAVSISIKSFAAGLSGKLQSGDIIQLNVADYGDLKQTIAPEELRYVELIAATNNTGVDNSKQEAKDKNKAEDMPSTLTVLVTQPQMLKLVDYENNGKLHAALVFRGSHENARKFLEMQDHFFEQTGGSTVNGN